MKSSPYLILLGALLAGPALAQPLQVVAERSEITFTTRQMGVPVDGRFDRFTAQVLIDLKRPEQGSVRFAIDTGSARFGAAETDAEVKKPVWLNVAAFPQAVFQSSAIKAVGAGRFDVAGKLTIKGLAREVTVPVQLAQAGGTGTGTASGGFTLKRLEYKVGDGEWSDTSLVADDVQVRFKLTLNGMEAM